MCIYIGLEGISIYDWKELNALANKALSRIVYRSDGQLTKCKFGTSSQYHRQQVKKWNEGGGDYTTYHWGKSFHHEKEYTKQRERFNKIVDENESKATTAGDAIPGANKDIGGAGLERGFIRDLGNKTPEVNDWIAHWWEPFGVLGEADGDKTNWASCKIIRTRVHKGKLLYVCRYRLKGELLHDREHALEREKYGVENAGKDSLWVFLGKE